MSIGSISSSARYSYPAEPSRRNGCPNCGGSGSEDNAQANPGSAKELSEEERREVIELKKRDTEVKAHEAAHVAAGGQHVRGGASFEYQTGPDGQRYAVGGEVSIDTSPEKDPEATIAKMQVVRRAAMAPASPSGADRAVAAAASATEAAARQELLKETAGEKEGVDGKESAAGKEAPTEEKHLPKTVKQYGIASLAKTERPAFLDIIA